MPAWPFVERVPSVTFKPVAAYFLIEGCRGGRAYSTPVAGKRPASMSALLLCRNSANMAAQTIGQCATRCNSYKG